MEIILQFFLLQNMKRWLSFAINWLTVLVLPFILEKGIFLLYFFHKTLQLSGGDIVGVFTHGLWLDVSLTSYLITLPLVFFLIQLLIEKRMMNMFFKIYLPVIFFIIGLLFVGDLGIYENWSTKLNVRAIQNIFHPSEMIASAGASPVWLYILIIVAHVIYGWYAAKYLSKKKFASAIGGIRWLNIPYFILMSGFTFLGIRGGWQVAPMNQSSAYFSQNAFANHAAINTTWYAIQSIINIKKYDEHNPYKFMIDEKAKDLVADLYQTKNDSSLKIFKTEKPNIVFIQIESYGADVVKELGGMEGLTPNLSKIIKEGMLFENIYASGFRTDQGLVSMLSGFPAQPNVSIIWNTEKQEKLPTITQKIKQNGYNTQLIYAGDILFSNMKAFVVHNGFEKVITENDFAISDRTSKWGVYDGVMFQRAIKEINEIKQPFFTYLITLTSHEPYDIPTQPKFPGDDAKEKFMSACYYTDQTLGEFFNEAKQQSWYANTVFVLCADHGHRFPFNREAYMPAVHHIPLIVVGGVLNDSLVGKRISAIGSQTDIASTLLHQLGINADDFIWSTDLLNQSRENFAYYSFDDGFGWVSRKDTIAYSNTFKNLSWPYNSTDSLHSSIDTARAYLQTLFNAYLKY